MFSIVLQPASEPARTKHARLTGVVLEETIEERITLNISEGQGCGVCGRVLRTGWAKLAEEGFSSGTGLEQTGFLQRLPDAGLAGLAERRDRQAQRRAA